MVIERDTTIRIRSTTKERLDNLEFARKNTSYNELIERLIDDYEKGVER